MEFLVIRSIERSEYDKYYKNTNDELLLGGNKEYYLVLNKFADYDKAEEKTKELVSNFENIKGGI